MSKFWAETFEYLGTFKVEKILKGSLDSIPSPSPSVKIQIMAGKRWLRCKSKTLLVTNLLESKSLLTSPSKVLKFIYSEKGEISQILWPSQNI